MQDENPFDEKSMSLFGSLYEFELDIHIESVLYNIDDAALYRELKDKIGVLYKEVAPVTPEIAPGLAAEMNQPISPLPPLEKLKFQSIAEFYNKGILPLYEQAFDFGWIRYSNSNLINELLDPRVAG